MADDGGSALPGGAGTAAGAAGGEDLLSKLPDDILAQILARLHCARAAARSSILSSSWLGLWRRIPELHFKDISPGNLDVALAQFTGYAHAVEYLEVQVPDHHQVSPQRISSWLLAAANLAPRKLVFVATPGEGDHAVKLPCFNRSTSMYLRLGCALDKFEEDLPELQELTLSSVRFDSDHLLARCPCLRVLSVFGSVQKMTVLSASLRKLYLQTDNQLQLLEVNADNLKEVLLSNYSILFIDNNAKSAASVSLMVPNIEKLTWSCHFRFGNFMMKNMDCLTELIVDDITSHSDQNENGELQKFLQNFRSKRIQKLHLSIDIPRTIDDQYKSLIEDIVELPIVSVLEIQMWTEGHCYGPVVLHILSLSYGIGALKIQLASVKVDTVCSLECPCDQPKCWRKEAVALPALQQVVVENFSGAEHELDFLDLLVRSSPILSNVTVVLSDQIVANDDVLRRIICICKALGNSTCYVYDAYENLVAKS